MRLSVAEELGLRGDVAGEIQHIAICGGILCDLLGPYCTWNQLIVVFEAGPRASWTLFKLSWKVQSK